MTQQNQVRNLLRNATFPYTHDGIAAMLGIPTPSVRRLTQELRDELEVHTFRDGMKGFLLRAWKR